ncbi:MAG: hypothetical protein KHW59_01440 [Clostridiales bacterium]|nr:hypothetical protein [Clostridiales bacterium]
MSKRTRVLLWSILVLLLMSVCFLVFIIIQKNYASIENFDVAYLNEAAEDILQEYGPAQKMDITSCDPFVQNGQFFVFFEYQPLEGDPSINEMPKDVIERSVFFGYAQIGKNFNTYYVKDFQTTQYDTVDIAEASRNASVDIYAEKPTRYYGKILDENVDKIEFYVNDVLVGTYNVGEKDYYFIELPPRNAIDTISYRFYDSENRFLYD